MEPCATARCVRKSGWAAFATKLWLKDAARFRFGDYHWEKRRRRLHEHDRKTGRATGR